MLRAVTVVVAVAVFVVATEFICVWTTVEGSVVVLTAVTVDGAAVDTTVTVEGAAGIGCN